MTRETPALARVSRALTHYERRYQRAVNSARLLSKEQLEEAAARLLVVAMLDRAFSGLILEVTANASEEAAKGLVMENALMRVVSIIHQARRAKGGYAKSAKNAPAREAVRLAWANAVRSGRGAKTSFTVKAAAEHGVSTRTIENWLK